MVTVPDLGVRLGRLIDDAVLRPREAKRLAGHLVLDAAGGPVYTENSLREYRRLESLLLRFAELNFVGTQASRDLASEFGTRVSLGYVNPYEARRLAGHLVFSSAGFEIQHREVWRRDRKLVTDLGLASFIRVFREESRDLAASS